MDSYCLNNATFQRMGRLKFQTQASDFLAFATMYVCLPICKWHERTGRLENTVTTVGYTACIIFPYTARKFYILACKLGRASVYQLYPGCLQKLKPLRERLLKKHTCPFQIILKYPILSLMFLALCPCFFSMAGRRPSCSLKVKEKPKRMCPLSGLWIHFQMTLFSQCCL